jgi:peptide-methionine (R)-S-oxide reductase
MQDDEFKRKLNPEQYRVMREGGKESEYSGKYWDSFEKGTYKCAACGTALFSSDDKFDSGTGWPSFHKPLNVNDIEFKKEPNINGLLDIRCKKCHSHIGAVVPGEPAYYRISSNAMKFIKDESLPLAEIKDTLEDVRDAQDQILSEPEPDQDSGWERTASYVSSIASFIGGGTAGLIVGAVGAYLICHATCGIGANSATDFTATSTNSITPIATTTKANPKPKTGTTRATSSGASAAPEVTAPSAADGGVFGAPVATTTP